MSNPFSRIRSAAIDGRAHNPFFRKIQLKKLHDKLAENSSEIQKAIVEDTGHRRAEVKAEYWLTLRCLADNYDAIDPESDLKTEYAIANSKDAPEAREPVGIVVIEPAAHTFVFSLISALGPALAAGNCVIIQVSRVGKYISAVFELKRGGSTVADSMFKQVEQTMLKTPRLLLKLLGDALDGGIFHATFSKVTDAEIGHRYVRVPQNGSSDPAWANHLLSRPQARVVAIIERDADLHAAADALVTARYSLGGKSPYAPDLVLVNEWVKKGFLEAVTQSAVRFTPDAGDAQMIKSRVGGKRLLDKIAKEEAAKIISSSPQGVVLDIEER